MIRQWGHSFCCLHSEKCTLLWLIYRITASFQEIPANWISIIVLTSHILCYANSVVNPFIYNFMSGVYEKNSNLFIIIYIFVETKIQSLLLCLFTSTNDAIEYERMWFVSSLAIIHWFKALWFIPICIAIYKKFFLEVIYGSWLYIMEINRLYKKVIFYCLNCSSSISV